MRQRGHQRIRLGVDVKQRQAGPQTLRSFEADPARKGCAGFRIGRVPDHHPLGAARCSGGVDDGGDFQRFDVDCWSLRLDRRGIKRVDLVVQQGDRRVQVIAYVLDLGVGQLGVDGRRDAARMNRAEPGMHQRRRVGCRHQHPVARGETATAQLLSRRASGPRQVAERFGPLRRDDRGCVAEALFGRSEQLRHRGEAQSDAFPSPACGGGSGRGPRTSWATLNAVCAAGMPQ